MGKNTCRIIGKNEYIVHLSGRCPERKNNLCDQLKNKGIYELLFKQAYDLS